MGVEVEVEVVMEVEQEGEDPLTLTQELAQEEDMVETNYLDNPPMSSLNVVCEWHATRLGYLSEDMLANDVGDWFPPYAMRHVTVHSSSTRHTSPQGEVITLGQSKTGSGEERKTHRF